MEIISNREEMIFKTMYKDKAFYTIGVSKKKQDGSYENGYIPVRFTKDTQLENRTKIKIKNAWLDFYVKDKKTYPYIFINDFKEVLQVNQLKTKTESQIGEQIEITPDDFPF